MLYVEWDEATHRKAWEDYGREEGRVEGRVEERKRIFALLRQGVPVEEAERMLNSQPTEQAHA
jgi:hypothetical protein